MKILVLESKDVGTIEKRRDLKKTYCIVMILREKLKPQLKSPKILKF